MRRSVSIAEIEYRGWQEATKWLERVSGARGLASPQDILRRRAPRVADPVSAAALLRDYLPQRFFAGATDPHALAAYADRCSGRVRELLDRADAILAGRFNLLGYEALHYGDPLDWHWDPVSNRRAPLRHWSRINALDPDVTGDAKVIWELNRLQWVVHLAQAYAVSSDDRYARACVRAIDAWIEANPPSHGINWASSLEVAYRLIAWCWTLVLIRHSPSLSGNWVMKVLAAIWRHGNHVRRYLSYYFSPNTHLTGEALGLFYAGVLFPEFTDAAAWRNRGARILIDQSAQQILPDGVYFEQSTCYQRYTFDIYFHFLQLAARNGVTVPGEVSQRLQRLAEFLLVVRQPDGSIPQIGDGDGGSLLPLAVRKPWDARGVFALAAARYDRQDFAWAAEGDVQEICWLLGTDGLRAFDRVTPAPPTLAPSKLFAHGGYAVMRSGWQRDAHQLIVDVGTLGCPVTAGHGHADLLSVQCAVFGEPCLVDAGTGSYVSGSRWRNYFRGTAAHSTVRVDGRDQTDPAGPFQWRARPAAQLRAWRSGPDLDVVDAVHDAYLGLPQPVLHRRRVFFVKPDYWVIVDDLSVDSLSASADAGSAQAKHSVEVRFQFAPLQVELSDEGTARVETTAGHTLWVIPFASAAIGAGIEAGWVSPDYGQRQPAPALVYSSAAALPWRMLTLLLPERGVIGSPPAVHAWRNSDGLPIAITFQNSHVRYRRHFAF